MPTRQEEEISNENTVQKWTNKMSTSMLVTFSFKSLRFTAIYDPFHFTDFLYFSTIIKNHRIVNHKDFYGFWIGQLEQIFLFEKGHK